MKTITRFNSYNNGPDSRMNVHFSDGTQFSRHISAQDAIRIAKEGKDCLAELMQKYATPDPKPQRYHKSRIEERFWELHHMQQLGILDEEQKDEYYSLMASDLGNGEE